MTPTAIEKLKQVVNVDYRDLTKAECRSLIAALEAAQGENQELRRAAQDEAILKTRLNAVSAAKDAEIERLSGCLKAEADRLDAKCGELLRSNLALVAAEAALKEILDLCPATSEMSPAHAMAEIARALLSKQDSGGRL